MSEKVLKYFSKSFLKYRKHLAQQVPARKMNTTFILVAIISQKWFSFCLFEVKQHNCDTSAPLRKCADIAIIKASLSAEALKHNGYVSEYKGLNKLGDRMLQLHKQIHEHVCKDDCYYYSDSLSFFMKQYYWKQVTFDHPEDEQTGVCKDQ